MAKQTFESAMKQLEGIVKELETGDLPLEKALQRFEEGMKLSKYCTAKLDETEKKITRLIKDHQGGISEVPFLEEESHPPDEAD